MDTQFVKPKTVHIVGGGFSGLVTAYYLQKLGMRVSLFERESHLGGVIQTEHHALGLVETAANAFLNTVELQAMCEDIGCTLIHTLPQSRRRYFFRDNKLSRFPLRFLEMPGFLVKVVKLFLKRDLKPRSDESMFQWAERNFGKAASLHMVGTALNGIYSGDVKSLSADLIVSPFFKKKSAQTQKVKRGSVAPYGGMADFIQCLKQHLISQAVEFHQASIEPKQIEEWRREGKQVVLSVGAKAAAQLLKTAAPELSLQLSRIKTMPLISAHVFWQEPCKQINGFGALIDEQEGLKALGVLANNRIFANRGAQYSETWIFGGIRSPEVFSLNDQDIQNLVLKESKTIFKEERKVASLSIHRWADVLPHYDFTLKEVLANLPKQDGIYHIGNYTGRIGLSKILDQAKVLAQEVANDERQSRAVVGQRRDAEIQSQF